MTLQFIDIDHLTISPLNVRTYRAKDCDDLVTSIRALGVLQPLLVRPAGETFEVIAGQRRLNACRIIAETGESDPIPCLVMQEGDDAAAIEASLAENIERLPMDEVDQYKAFAQLVKQGRDTDDIAATFGITPRMVTQRLALGRLHPPILTAYRKEEVSPGDIRTLTMATPKQQKAWWALVKDDEAYVPKGQRLKDWLFGGANIPITNALFDVEDCGLAVVADLFGNDSYFADSEAFWALQNTAIDEAVKRLKADGWRDVILLNQGEWFLTWDYRTCPKEDGGKVFVTTTHQGEVAFYEGYITRAEAGRRERGLDETTPAPKPELTKAAQTYVDLHRHAAVRSDLLGNSSLALRVIAAHMICGSDLWHIRTEPQKAAKGCIAKSLQDNAGQHAMNAERQAIQLLLAIPEDEEVCRPYISQVFESLQTLSDTEVTRILTFLMAETLWVHSPLIDTLGAVMGTTMRDHWQPDHTFFDLIRDKQVLNAMVGEFAGQEVAAANVTEAAKTHRAILADCLNGTRTPADANWAPPYMTFPQGSYQEQDNTVSVEADCEEAFAIAAE